MDQLGTYIAPLLLINGVGLIILSTSSRYIHVSDVLQKMTPNECEVHKARVQKELRRAHLFRNALVGCYFSIGFFASSALIGGLIQAYPKFSNLVLQTFTIAGVACTVFAATQLIIESILSLEIVKRHSEGMNNINHKAEHA